MTRFREPPEFVICIFNGQNPASLERRKLYRVVESEPTDPKDFIRIVDESGEDYLFPRDWFMPINVSDEVAEALSPDESPVVG